MLPYLLRRLLLFIPTLLLVSIATFTLSHCSGGDPIPYEFESQPAAYLAQARQMALDKPLFYFSVRSLALPDTLHRILPLHVRDHLSALAQRCGNWEAVERYWRAVQHARSVLQPHATGDVLNALSNMYWARTPSEALQAVHMLKQALQQLHRPSSGAAEDALNAVEHAATYWMQQPQRWRAWLPRWRWHGPDNQYHRWVVGFLSGNPGLSTVTGNPLLTELRPRLYATLFINGMALMLAYGMGIPLGVYMARYRRYWAVDRGLRMGLLFLYSMPVIWVGSVLLWWLARPDVGLGWLNAAHAEPWLLSGKPFWAWVADNYQSFLLPVLTLSLHYCAVIALQMRTGLVTALQQDYIRTAYAKGLSNRAVFWRHAFRDSLFPVIGTFGYLFPTVLSGSIVVEYLFDFPGLGVKLQTSFAQHDYPVLFAMVMFIAAITLLGMFIADVLYARIDPRVRFERSD